MGLAVSVGAGVEVAVAGGVGVEVSGMSVLVGISVAV